MSNQLITKSLESQVSCQPNHVEPETSWSPSHLNLKSVDNGIIWAPNQLPTKSTESQSIWTSNQLTTKSFVSLIMWQPNRSHPKSVAHPNHLNLKPVDNQITSDLNQLIARAFEPRIKCQPSLLKLKPLDSQIIWIPNHLTLKAFKSPTSSQPNHVDPKSNHWSINSVDRQSIWESRTNCQPNHLNPNSLESQINWQPDHLNLKSLESQISWHTKPLNLKSADFRTKWIPHLLFLYVLYLWKLPPPPRAVEMLRGFRNGFARKAWSLSWRACSLAFWPQIAVLIHYNEFAPYYIKCFLGWIHFSPALRALCYLLNHLLL